MLGKECKDKEQISVVPYSIRSDITEFWRNILKRDKIVFKNTESFHKKFCRMFTNILGQTQWDFLNTLLL
jgi:Mg2+ and Co2+ transporter CorA